MYRRIVPADLRQKLGKTEILIKYDKISARDIVHHTEYIDAMVSHLFQQLRQGVVVKDMLEPGMMSFCIGSQESNDIADDLLKQYRRLYSSADIEDILSIPKKNIPPSIRKILLKERGYYIKNDVQPVLITKLSDHIDAYLAIKKSDPNMALKNFNKYKKLKEELLWFFGDIDHTLNTDDVKKYAEFWKLPVSWFECRKNMSPTEYRRMINSKNVKIPDKKFLANTTRNDMLGRIVDFLKYYQDKTSTYGLADSFIGNSEQARQPVPARKIRPFTEEEIVKIFDEIKTDKYWKGKGRDTRWRYWVFMLCLYTGARPNEICQADIDDIIIENKKSEGGKIQAFIKIRPEAGISPDNNRLTPTTAKVKDLKKTGKTIKTASALRDIPIHSWIIEDGFLEYYESAKNRYDGRLFPCRRDPHNGASHQAVKFFSQLIKDLNLNKNEGQSDQQGNLILPCKFYSVRHTVENQFTQIEINGTPLGLARLRLMGRELPAGLEVKTYSADIPLENLRRVIEFLHYPLKHYSDADVVVEDPVTEEIPIDIDF